MLSTTKQSIVKHAATFSGKHPTDNASRRQTWRIGMEMEQRHLADADRVSFRTLLENVPNKQIAHGMIEFLLAQPEMTVQEMANLTHKPQKPAEKPQKAAQKAQRTVQRMAQPTAEEARLIEIGRQVLSGKLGKVAKKHAVAI